MQEWNYRNGHAWLFMSWKQNENVERNPIPNCKQCVLLEDCKSWT